MIILSDADDSNVLGPPDQVEGCVREIHRIFAEKGMHLKKSDMLLGSRISEQDPDGTTTAAILTNFEAIIGAGKVTMADTGIIAGAANAYPDGIRIVGTPIGSKEYAAEYVETQIRKHSERLSHVKTLGRVSVQAALLLIHWCCIPRLNYLMQTVPYRVAPAAYERGRDEIVNLWRETIGVSDEMMAGYGVQELISQPFKFGGQQLLNFKSLGNAALVGCMAAVAADIKSAVHGLQDLGDEDTPIPRWGSFYLVHEELGAEGEDVRAVLPDIEEIFEDTTPRLQGTILAAIHATVFEKMHHGPGDANELSFNREARWATIRSRSQVGAMDWHTAAGYHKGLILSNDQARRTVLNECGMKQPGLASGYENRSLNDMTSAEVAKVVGHHALNQASTGLGGFLSSHNGLVSCLETIVDSCNLRSLKQLSGRLGSNPGSSVDTQGDLLIIGVDPSNNGIMVDVSITNCVTGQGRAKGQAAQVTGHAADQVLTKKTNRYKNLCRDNAMESCWFVAETTGGLSQPAIDLLKRLAKHIDIHRLSARDTPNALAGRRYRQWLQAISITRAKTNADRLRGAAAEATANATVPRHHAAALLSQF